MAAGIAIAAPRSGEGKTMIALGILGALKAEGVRVHAAKSGPDYIDPQYLAAAVGSPCLTLDSWAMSPNRLRALAGAVEGLLVIEGAMGLYDGAPDAADPGGRGSTADLALALGVPVVLVLDVSRQAQTAAAVARGLAEHHSGIEIPGVILNRVGSLRHRQSIERALGAVGLPVIGAFPRQKALEAPSRHLGLVQAREREDLESFVETAASLAAEHVDIAHFQSIATRMRIDGEKEAIAPLGQRIAVARDDAFAFTYEHLLAAWRGGGAEIEFFSPLQDEAPSSSADAIFLPGGYPELHAARIASCNRFRTGVRDAAMRGAVVYGECGGYMALGRGLVDAEGQRHEMLGLLPVETSFAVPQLSLGYRFLRPHPNPVWPRDRITAHEFHYASEARADTGAQSLFAAWDSEGSPLPDMGVRVGRVMGSFAHVIDWQ